MQTSVLIVGGGPVGLSLALLLARQGVAVRVIDKADSPSITSKAQLVHARTLLLFDGEGATEHGYARLGEIAGSVRALHGGAVRTVVVVPAAQRPEALAPEIEVVHDPQGSLHGAFHVRTEALYLIRPDGHVGFRSLPADGAALIAHLAHALGPGAPVGLGTGAI